MSNIWKLYYFSLFDWINDELLSNDITLTRIFTQINKVKIHQEYCFGRIDSSLNIIKYEIKGNEDKNIPFDLFVSSKTLGYTLIIPSSKTSCESLLYSSDEL